MQHRVIIVVAGIRDVVNMEERTCPKPHQNRDDSKQSFNLPHKQGDLTPTRRSQWPL